MPLIDVALVTLFDFVATRVANGRDVVAFVGDVADVADVAAVANVAIVADVAVVLPVAVDFVVSMGWFCIDVNRHPYFCVVALFVGFHQRPSFPSLRKRPKKKTNVSAEKQ
jgi:hypothetical protein